MHVENDMKPTQAIMTSDNIIPVDPKLIGNNNTTLPTMQLNMAKIVDIEDDCDGGSIDSSDGN